jgi:hypothetical protein
MSISFITLKANTEGAWNIIKVTNSSQSKDKVTVLDQPYKDLKIAKVVAKSIAKENRLKLVPENTKVASIIKLDNLYLPITMDSSGQTQGQGQCIPKEAAIGQAILHAEKHQLPLILPNNA